MFNAERLRQVSIPASEKTLQEAQYRAENWSWLKKSALLALAVRRELRLRGMSQQELAGKMGVTPQYVGRILKGRENLGLETISKLEDALGIGLLTIRSSADFMHTTHGQVCQETQVVRVVVEEKYRYAAGPSDWQRSFTVKPSQYCLS